MRGIFQRRSPNRPGFTLIELLVVIGIIGALASIVVVAINPLKHLGDAADADRMRLSSELQKAEYQFLIDHGRFAANQTVPDDEVNAKALCRFGLTDASCINMDELVPDYVACLPYDGAETNPLFSGFAVYQVVGRLFVKAQHLGERRTQLGGCEG